VLRPDGTCSENVYAKFFYDFFGLKIEDPQKYAALVRAGEKPDVKIVLEDELRLFNISFVSFARYLNKLSGLILEQFSKAGLSPSEVPGVQKYTLRSIDELVAKIVETVAQVAVGVNKVSTFIFSIRKTTPQYLKSAYGDVSAELLEILGFSKIFEGGGIELLGFPDYFTITFFEKRSYKIYVDAPMIRYYKKVESLLELLLLELEPVDLKNLSGFISPPSKLLEVFMPRTLGGLVCSLGEMFWQLRDVALFDFGTKWGREMLESKWFPELKNIRQEYAQSIDQSLREAGWHYPIHIKPFPLVAVGHMMPEISLVVYLADESLVVSKYLELRGRVPTRESTNDMPRYLHLSELVTYLMPAVFVGYLDFTLWFCRVDNIEESNIQSCRRELGIVVYDRESYIS